MSNILTSVETELSERDRKAIVRALVVENDRRGPHEDYGDLHVVSRRDGQIVAGLLGHTHWNWLFIRQVWVADGFQRQGLGRTLMFTAEREACRRRCFHAHCDTFDFQALPFFQKLGYVVFASLEDFPKGHTRYFLQKRDLGSSRPL